MNAIVVYESLWGNTAAVAGAIAEGIGDGARSLDTDRRPPRRDERRPDRRWGTGHRLRAAAGGGAQADRRRHQVPGAAGCLPPAAAILARGAASRSRLGCRIETRIWWSPRGATGTIESKLKRAGYQRLASSQRFKVDGSYGPLREGELERARLWGTELAQTLAAKLANAT